MVVRKIVVEVERKVLSNFGKHWRSLELDAAGATAEKVFLMGNFMRSLMV